MGRESHHYNSSKPAVPLLARQLGMSLKRLLPPCLSGSLVLKFARRDLGGIVTVESSAPRGRAFLLLIQPCLDLAAFAAFSATMSSAASRVTHRHSMGVDLGADTSGSTNFKLPAMQAEFSAAIVETASPKLPSHNHALNK